MYTISKMPSPKSVIFCGTPDFALPSLEALVNDPEFTVSLVVTQPDKPVGRTQKLMPPSVKEWAENNNIPVLQPKNINKELTSAIQEPPDFLVTIAYGQILKSNILTIPKIAAVNVHGSLLPRWRGASPIQHAILEGDSISGVTIQKMVEKLDAGPILSQKEIELSPQETYSSLHDKLADDAAILIVDTLNKSLSSTEQDESKATLCKKLTRKDGEVDPKTMTAEEIDRHVRALMPWPGVTCEVIGENVKLHETSLTKNPDAMPLTCKNDTTIFITKIQSPGKKPVRGNEWSRGHQR